MAINVVRFERNGETHWGVVRGDKIVQVPGYFATTGVFIQKNKYAYLKDLSGEEISRSSVDILSPVTQNQQFICQGANYRQHMIESGMNPDAKKFNMIFTKAPSCISPWNSKLVVPSHVRFMDYEIELGLILKVDTTAAVVVTDRNIGDYVAGLVIVNDYSARDVQISQMQFYKGKSYRTFGPIGPYLCLLAPEDYPKIYDLKLRLTVNGQVRQEDTTANLVYGPAETLTELTGLQDLNAGDLIATGTPAGCALRVPSPLKQRLVGLLPEHVKWKAFYAIQAKRPEYLKDGDVVEAHIKSADGAIDLGIQRNHVIRGA